MLLGLAPELLPGKFVFCTVPDAALADFSALSPLACFREREGLTLVVTQAAAQEAGLQYTFLSRCITLGLNSSLDAVGLTAAVATRLAQRGISANVIAAYHHDHIFVPAAQANDALVALQEFGAQSQS